MNDTDTTSRVCLLVEHAEKIAASWDLGPMAQRRIHHARRIVDKAQMPGCHAISGSRYLPYMNANDAPDLGAALFKRHKPATAALVDEQGKADVLTEAAAILKAFRSANDHDKGRMLMDAVRLDGTHQRAWAFWEGCGANERPEVLVQDLNVTSRLARWFQIYLQDLRVQAEPEGFSVSIREADSGGYDPREWFSDGGRHIELRVEYFEMFSDALAGAMVIYFYARHVRLTKAWLRGL